MIDFVFVCLYYLLVIFIFIIYNNLYICVIIFVIPNNIIGVCDAAIVPDYIFAVYDAVMTGAVVIIVSIVNFIIVCSLFLFVFITKCF